MGVSTSAADYQPPGTSRAAQRAAMIRLYAVAYAAFVALILIIAFTPIPGIVPFHRGPFEDGIMYGSILIGAPVMFYAWRKFG